jgi:DNA topoisomerase-3
VAKSLIITEKPSVARDIAASLGGFREEGGYFESDAWVLTWAVGHLFELLEPEEIDPEYKRWTLANLPIIPDEFKTKPKQGQSERVRTIKKLLERSDVESVVNACDAGREGELIFREIVEHFDSSKPIRRLWLQSMTEEAIRDGFANLRPGEELENLAAAAEARALTDWLIGMNATRALTKRLKGRREKGAWSAGRVQTPTLALLVERELEVLVHVPKPYWRLVGSFDQAGNAYTGNWFDPALDDPDDDATRDDRLFDEARAQAIVAKCAGRPGVAEETRKPSRENAPPLFDLTSLQREAIRRFSWTARRTLSAAQRCYEAHKLLTYPRTDSRCLPNDYRAKVREILDGFAAAGRAVRSKEDPVADYAAAADRLLRSGLQNEGRTFDDTKVSDHFAIIPTGKLPGADLSGDDRKIYDLVVRRFLGNFHSAAVWERVERLTVIEGERFRSRARTLTEPGWRAIGDPPGAPPDVEKAAERRPFGRKARAGATPSGDAPLEDDVISALPPLRAGATESSGVAVATTGVEIVAEQTKPLPRITEARLLSLMENAGKDLEDEDFAAAMHERGLGTPATRAEIIENLIAKGYAVRLGRAIRPTAKGIRLIDILRRVHIDGLTSAELTGEMEHHLAQVEHGQRDAREFMDEMRAYTREIVEHAKSFEYEELYASDPDLGPCPSCGRKVVEAPWFYRCEEKPERDPDCPLRIWKDTSGRYIDRVTAAAVVRDGKSGVLEGFTARNGRTYQGTLEIEPGTWAVRVKPVAWEEGVVSENPEYEVNPEPLGACPFEEDCHVVESSTQFLCERKLKEMDLEEGVERPKSCGFVFPRTVCKREITRDEALHYVANKRTELLTDFTSRYGRPFSAMLVLRENGRHGFEFLPRGNKAAGEGAAAPAEGAAPAKPKRARGSKAAATHEGDAKPAKRPARKAAAKKKPARSAAKSRSRTRKAPADPTSSD